MNEDKSSISQAQSYQAIGEFWDTHDVSDVWDETHPAEFKVNIQSETMYYPLETRLSAQLRALATQHGVSAETLLNLWVQEKLAQETHAQ